MKHYFAFLKKEFMESARTYKLMILLLLFFVTGVMNPLTAKLTPDLLRQFMPEDMILNIPAPTALDSWAQFFKNTTQLGIVVMVIVFSGILGQELAKGTLINLLTKGLSRKTVILAKFTYMALLWTTCLIMSFLVSWGYTVYLFPDGKTAHLLYSVFCVWLFGIFVLALLLLGAALVNNSYGTLLITGAGMVICMIINIVPKAYRFNPFSLASKNMDLLTKTIAVSSLYNVTLVTAVLTVGFVGLAVVIFKKRNL